MSASLIVAGYELLGSTTNPEYRLAGDWDFGAGEPDQTTIASLYLDGETVTGSRTRNRSMRLPLTVVGSNPSDLASKVSTLVQAVNADTFTVQWTPDGGLPVVFDCYRATAVRPRDLLRDAQGLTQLILEFQAKPFGRSADSTQTVSVSTSTQIDSFDTAPTGATLDTSHKIEGTGSAKYTNAVAVSRTFAAKNLAAHSRASVWNLIAATGSGLQTVTVNATLTLSSASGSTRYSAITSYSVNATSNLWQLLSFDLTAGTIVTGTGVTLSAVTGYSLLPSNVYGAKAGVVTTVGNFYDDLRGSGTSAAQTTTTHGATILVPGILGSARTPVNLALTNGSTFTSMLVHTPPLSEDSNLGTLQSLSTASTDQTVTIAATNARFGGTYSVILGVGTSGGGSVTATVTITQLENAVAVGSTQVLTKTYTSGPLLVALGEVTLPLYAVPADNSLTTFTVRVQITGLDRYSEVMLLDTAGQTVFTDSNLSTARTAVYIDEPSALQSGPSVYASASDRTVAFSAMGNCVMSGGPILFEPGTNRLMAWVGTATPTVSATYDPRWLDERVS